MRIVIVEDEIKIREGMGKLISSRTDHIIVGEASDGEAGLDMILRFKPDLVITDIRMPKMSGLAMLKELSERKVMVHAVILSGYSEFEYAKKAIHYGVDDYLLKPLAVEDVEHMLKKISEKIIQEERLTYGTPENHLRDVLIGNVKECKSEYEKLEKVCGFQKGMNYVLMLGYIGIAPAGYRINVETIVAKLKETYPERKSYLFYLENEQMLYCISSGEKQEIKRRDDFVSAFFHKAIWKYTKMNERPIWTKGEFDNIEQLKEMGKMLRENLTEALMINSTNWITREILKMEEVEEYYDPADINIQLKGAICQGDNEKIKKVAEQFLNYVEIHRFAPEDIRQAFDKSYFLILNTLQDIDKVLYDHLQSTNTRQLISQAMTWKELKTAYLDAIQILIGPKAKREDISNYIIQKAICYIQNHYQEGITLEEVSTILEITPEYLSTLFNREVGINFSTFLKQFRISHAKRLLKGTDKRVYEIAELVGYSDAKYFARVFKEEQGVSPGDYRQMN